MKFFLMMVFGILFTVSNVSAEQPKAQEYREILSSEKFYVEYDDKYIKKIIIEDDGRRMSRVTLGGKYEKMVSVLNPLAKIFENSYSKYPDFMYYKDKYYRFIDKDYASMVSTSQLDDENLNPNEGWSLMDKELSLPDELAVFNWNERHHKVSDNISEPIFTETISKTIENKTYICDRYESNVKTSANTKIIFDMCYDEKGELSLVQSAIFSNNREYGINALVVKKILREIPKDAIVLDKNAKIYAAGIGDMNDLLENPVLVGKLQEIQDS